MSEKTKIVKLVNDKQIFGELRHFVCEHTGTISIEIEGTITPTKIFGSRDFKTVRLFRMETSNYIPMATGVCLPTFEFLKKDLQCPALNEEIIRYLESIPLKYGYLDSSRVKSAMPFVIKRLRNEGKPLRLSLPKEAVLLGELMIDKGSPSNNLVIVGSVLFSNGEEKLIEFYRFRDIFHWWSPISEARPTKYERKNTPLWNKELAKLLVSFITEIAAFTKFQNNLLKGAGYIAGKNKRVQFCNKLRQELLTAEEGDLRNPKVLEAFKTIFDICKIKLNIQLLQ